LYWQAAGKEYQTGKKSFSKSLKENTRHCFKTYGGIQHHKYLAKFKQLPDLDQKNPELKCHAPL
jgi:tryptophan 2,3-dioxygenase